MLSVIGVVLLACFCMSPAAQLHTTPWCTDEVHEVLLPTNAAGNGIDTAAQRVLAELLAELLHGSSPTTLWAVTGSAVAVLWQQVRATERGRRSGMLIYVRFGSRGVSASALGCIFT